MIKRLLSFLSFVALGVCPCPGAGPVDSIRILLPPNPGPITLRASAILHRQITGRCEARVSTNGLAGCSVELALRPGIGTEGYRISDGPNGLIQITGSDERGLLYGAGRFLRDSRYDDGRSEEPRLNSSH